MSIWSKRLRLVVLVTMVVPLFGVQAAVAQTTASRTFPETGKTVSGRFLEYWTTHGGLTQQGFPISNEIRERSDTDGKTYTVQYFERAVFELHPENRAPNDVLLSLLGVFLYKQKYPNGAPDQTRSKAQGPVIFTVTGKTVGGVFLDYWRTNGGLAQQGFPISEEFQEKSALNGKTYTVQYFERAVFELHPENAGTPFEVLLSQLGKFRYNDKYGTGKPTPAMIPTSTSTAAPTATPTQTPLPTATTAPTGEQQLSLTLREWSITPGQSQIAPGKLKIMVNNAGQQAHNFTVLSEQGAIVNKTPNFRSADGTKVLEVDLPPGTYSFICSIPGHAEAGQRASLTVR